MTQKYGVALVFSMLICLHAVSSEPSLLYVQGEASVSSLPDQVVIRIQSNAEEKTYQHTINALKNKVEKIHQALAKELPVDQVKTGRIQIRENKVYQDRAHVFAGYIATQTISIELPFDAAQVNQILQSLTQSEADAAFSMDFTLSDTKRETLQKKAMQEAVKDAGEKAKSLAEAANMSLGKVQEIRYGVSTPIGVNPFDFKSVRSGNAASQTSSFHLEPDEVNVSERVSMIFSIHE